MFQMLFKKSLRYRHKIFVVMLFSTLFLFLMMTLYYKNNNDALMDINYARRLEEMQLQEYVLKDKGKGCKMPQLDPYAKETMKYNYDMPQITCPGLDWVECKGDECYVKDEILNQYNDVKCVYKDILFADDINLKIGRQVRKYNNEIYKLIESDHVRVSCIAKKLESLRVPRLWYGFAAGFRRVMRVSVPPARHRDSPHVLILAFDSASHNGFLRRLPKSYKVITDELKAVVLKSFNVLGDGTKPNVFPLLTGKTELEILDPNIKNKKNHYIDPKDFIFHTMEQYGYRTAYFEDMPTIGTFQNYFRGFRYQPADHYLVSILLDKTKNGKTWWNGLKTRYCMGAVPQYAWMLNLTSQFLKLEGKHFIFTFIADISHDDFNLISTAEDDLVRFLREFRDSGFRENTLLVVMGDHGNRFSKARQTVQGKLEERLPFLAIALPERFVRDRPDALRALKANVDVLTTPHDLRATILDVVDMRDRWNNYTVPGSDIPRAMTMLEDIPRNRTCAEAGIVPHWCACSQWVPVPDTEPVFKEAAEALGHYINEITSEKRSQCIVRQIISIEYVNRLGSPSDVSAARDQFQIKITMSPGEAVFEGSVVRNNIEKTFTVSERDISRTNAYGDQPKCIVKTHPHLQKYCFCNDQQSNRR